MKQEVINKFLIDHGIRPLKRRVLIYNYLISRKNHPTVDTIYNFLSEKEPNLSKTTVYNVLNLFIEKNIVQAIAIEGNELRYDADTSIHGHFKCMSCNEVFDFLLDYDKMPKLPLEGFTPIHTEYNIIGQCCNCSRSNMN